ncbi:DUF3397 domain-containing protein [Priestia megaterium]|nr:DUF3397 domain-containing protein [Priestia megaterium]
MGNIVAGIFATFVTLPIVGFFILYIVLGRVTKNKRKAVHVSTYVTTVFLIISAYYFTNEMFNQSFLWLIVLILIIVAMIVMTVHWKVKKDLEMKRIAKGFFRMNFILFLIGHVVLVVSQLIRQVYSL